MLVAIWGKGISREERNKYKCPEVEESKAYFTNSMEASMMIMKRAREKW